MRLPAIVIFLLFSFFSAYAYKYIPIVLVHGVLSDDHGMRPTEHYISKYMGDDVYVKNIQLGSGHLTSLSNMYHQVEHLRTVIQSDAQLKDGFNFVVHSQGGLVSRYYLEHYNNPQVLTYISWGSPHQGVYGLPGRFEEKLQWLNYIEGYAHHLLYSWPFQKYFSFPSYWHDPIHYEKYVTHSIFLPYVNNEINHPHASLFKSNMCKLKNMVLVMSHKENIVEPRESCHFGFYKPGSKIELQTIFETDIYKKDTLGLKTLYESGRLHLLYADCTHSNFQEDERNFVENTLPFLLAHPNNVPLNDAAFAS